jgi:hypothetical protein
MIFERFAICRAGFEHVEMASIASSDRRSVARTVDEAKFRAAARVLPNLAEVRKILQNHLVD